MKYSVVILGAVLAALPVNTVAFVTTNQNRHPKLSFVTQQHAHPGGAVPLDVTVEGADTLNFIGTELRGAAMKLHTRMQAPKEGEAEVPEAPKEQYVTTRDDYLRFLVDSQHVYQVMEEIVNDKSDLAPFRNTGLERTVGLETDIQFLVSEYELTRPAVGPAGSAYAETLRRIAQEGTSPEFMNHYYNHYFAHTAGGRMIGKQMSKMLLDKKTLEFYKWDGDVNEMKGTVKGNIEEMAAGWSREEKDLCVNETAAAFRAGGSLNGYLGGSGGKVSGH